ncbi:ABC transporter permease [Gordonia rubripertincta]|uniref:ABC transporter permease n=1 Tax=Gordonia rubripertincta TaxID=36822 RepID=UPI000B8D4C63|nr:ABC transporter permease [Gordonia rubripertincta]ASR01407.1 Oligopeptide transport system permease protein OppC [Gordonia rubripertincta]
MAMLPPEPRGPQSGHLDATAPIMGETGGVLDESDTTSAPPDRRRSGRVKIFAKRYARNRSALLGLAIFVVLVLFAVFGGLFTAYSYTDTDFLAIGFPPSTQGAEGAHWFGTNDAGNDLYAQVVHGLQRSLTIALIVSVGTTAIAAFLGGLAAYFGGWMQRIVLGVVYLLLVVPTFLILALVSNSTGGDWRWLIVVLVAFGWMMLARVIHSLALTVRERDYVAAAKYLGVSPVMIILRHILPNVASLLVINFALGVVATVLAETGLSFLGFGVKIPDVTLGSLLQAGAGTLAASPWLFWFPAAALALLTVSMALIADGLRDAFDPTSSGGVRR